jgi:hypothetical protein
MNSFFIHHTASPHPQLICERDLSSVAQLEFTYQNGQLVFVGLKIAADENDGMRAILRGSKRKLQLPHSQIFQPFYCHIGKHTYNQFLITTINTSESCKTTVIVLHRIRKPVNHFVFRSADEADLVEGIEERAISIKCRRPFFNFFETGFCLLTKHRKILG